MGIVDLVGGFKMSVQALRRLTLGVWWTGADAYKLWGSSCVIPTPAGVFVLSWVSYTGCIAD